MKCNTCQNTHYCCDGNHELTRYGCTNNGFAAYVPQTNADRIRGKCETDEGLYAFILGVHSLTTDRYGDPDYRLVVEGEEFRDDERLLSWLKSPAEEGSREE